MRGNKEKSIVRAVKSSGPSVAGRRLGRAWEGGWCSADLWGHSGDSILFSLSTSGHHSAQRSTQHMPSEDTRQRAALG